MGRLKNVKRKGLIVGIIAFPVVSVFILAALSSAVAAQPEGVALTESSALEHRGFTDASVFPDAFVFRFDPVLRSFETFTIPTTGANPNSIDLVSHPGHVDVWFTAPGADQIGRLIYTSTNQTQFYTYSLAPGSQPLNLIIDRDRGMVWFTEQAGNRIGRLEIGAGSVVTYAGFDVATSDSQPAGIDLASDGSVWFSELAADKVAHLVVTTTSDYDIQEFATNGTGVGVYDAEVQSDRYVWFGERATGIVRRFDVLTQGWDRFIDLGDDSVPSDLLFDAKNPVLLWITDFRNNQITEVEFGTLTILTQFDVPLSGGNLRELAQVDDKEFWFVGHASGELGRFVYTTTVDFRIQLFDLTPNRLWAMDVVADDDGNLWTVAFSPDRVFTPIILQNQ